MENGQTPVLRNPDIANYLHLGQYMEMVGRGSLLVRNECRKAGLPNPKWKSNDSGATLSFHAPLNTGTDSRTESNPTEQTILNLLKNGSFSKSELAAKMGLNGISGALKNRIKHLWELSLIMWTIPGKLQSGFQKYMLTETGKQFFKDEKPWLLNVLLPACTI